MNDEMLQSTLHVAVRVGVCEENPVIKVSIITGEVTQIFLNINGCITKCCSSLTIQL